MKVKTVEEWKKALASLAQGEIDTLEQQVRTLGALILVPSNKLQVEVAVALRKMPATLRFERLSDQAKNIVIGGIAKVFDVSAGLMSNRLRQDKLP